MSSQHNTERPSAKPIQDLFVVTAASLCAPPVAIMADPFPPAFLWRLSYRLKRLAGVRSGEAVSASQHLKGGVMEQKATSVPSFQGESACL